MRYDDHELTVEQLLEKDKGYLSYSSSKLIVQRLLKSSRHYTIMRSTFGDFNFMLTTKSFDTSKANNSKKNPKFNTILRISDLILFPMK